jgi:hypothetical protein
MHCRWKNCPTTWSCQSSDKTKIVISSLKLTIVNEILVLACSIWITNWWNYKKSNVLNHLLLFIDLSNGVDNDLGFQVNGNQYLKYYSNWWMVSTLVGPYCHKLYTNHKVKVKALYTTTWSKCKRTLNKTLWSYKVDLQLYKSFFKQWDRNTISYFSLHVLFHIIW